MSVQIDKFTQSLRAAMRARHRQAGLAAAALAAWVIGEGRQLAPVALASEGGELPGTLRASAFQTPLEDGGMGGSLRVTVGFAADYALYVHEDLTASHAIGEAKYLETAMQRGRGRWPTIAKETVK